MTTTTIPDEGVELSDNARELYTRLLAACNDSLEFTYVASSEIGDFVVTLGYEPRHQCLVAHAMLELIAEGLVTRSTVRVGRIVSPQDYKRCTPYPRRVQVVIL